MRRMFSALLLTVAVALPGVAQAADPRDRGEGRMADREQIERSPEVEAQRAQADEARREVRETAWEQPPERMAERERTAPPVRAVAESREIRRDGSDDRRARPDSRPEIRPDRVVPVIVPVDLRTDRRDVRDGRDDRHDDRRGDWRDERRADWRDDRHLDRRDDRRFGRPDDRRDYRHDDRHDWRWDRVRWGRYDDRGWSFRYSTPSWNSYWTPFGFGYGDRLTVSWGLRWYDGDRDGRLSDREWRRAQAAFYRFADRNRDGYVSYREYDWAVDAIRYNRYGGW